MRPEEKDARPNTETQTFRDSDKPEISTDGRQEITGSESGSGEDLKKCRGEETPRQISETHQDTGEAPLSPLFVSFLLVTPAGPVPCPLPPAAAGPGLPPGSPSQPGATSLL